MPQFAGGCLEHFAIEKNGRQTKPILVQETLSWEDHILSWFLEEMEKIKEAGISEEIESYEPADLNKPLELFF